MMLSRIKSLANHVRVKLERSPQLLIILTNTGWLVTDRILRLGMGLVVAIWIARYLGPEQFGTYSYALALVALFSVVAALGLDGPLVRDIVRSPASRGEILGTAFILKVIGGVLAFLLAVMTVTALRPDDTLVRWLVAIIAASVVFRSFDVIDLWFLSQTRSKYAVMAKSAAFTTVVVIKVGLILGGAPLIAFAWAGFAEVILAAIALMIAYRTDGQHLVKWGMRFARAKILIRDSYPLILSGLAVMVYMKIDQIMIGSMIGDEAVGVYSAAVHVSEVWYFVPTAIVSSLFPAIVRMRQRSDKAYLDRFQKLYDLMTWLAIAIALPITFLGGHIIIYLFGETYVEAGTVLAVHIWAAVFVFLGVASGKWYLAENMTHILFKRALTGGVINVVLNIIFIPTFGIVGAATATLISQASAAYFYDIFNPVTRNMFYMKSKSLFFVSTFKSVANG